MTYQTYSRPGLRLNLHKQFVQPSKDALMKLLGKCTLRIPMQTKKLCSRGIYELEYVLREYALRASQYRFSLHMVSIVFKHAIEVDVI